MNIPDHPIIHNCELTGYSDGREPDYPHCPVCGSECEFIYRVEGSEIVGCDRCISAIDSWEVPECFPDK